MIANRASLSEALAEVQDSPGRGSRILSNSSYMPLFVVLSPGTVLTTPWRLGCATPYAQLSGARHVPNDIFAVQDIRRTLTGKKLELLIKKLVMVEPAERVLNRDSLANPRSIDWFVEFANGYLRSAK